jgi:hypothetical protein
MTVRMAAQRLRRHCALKGGLGHGIQLHTLWRSAGAVLARAYSSEEAEVRGKE